ncbi:CUE domain-containing protein 4, mitochondrial [Madurella mycetomatis]|uniref:Coupling of ubiquitin conjugation to ER degradation protein 1 n=1 Tax=Madurella mycetomatis TaxID=100816 RepID=A0A175VW96_9PEZI|nr:CUE domain-containing protein 4, mitochondrial [Madurella mycetomatis]
MADQHEQQQINVPSLVVILVLSGLIIRYLFFSPASSGTGTPSSSRGGTRNDQAALMRSRELAAERILQMFPQVDRRAVLWDLQRTGGNITATTERILRGRLETPPVTFQPPPPPDSDNNRAAGQGSKPVDQPTHPDLITRYNLKDKLNAPAAESGSSGAEANGKGNGKGWSTNRDERQSLLQKRRDQMILEARRKMEAKIAAEKAAGGR